MSLYAVYLPRSVSPIEQADKAVFVKQGFHFWAYAAPPLWAAWNRLWLTLVLWVLGGSALIAFVAYGLLDMELAWMIYLVAAFVFGLEAEEIQHGALVRRGYALTELTLAPRKGDAEFLFFHDWRPADRAAGVQQRDAAPGGDALGLFS